MGKFNLSTGALVKHYDFSGLLKGPRLLNDIAFDEKGNAYITESYSSKIFKISGDKITELTSGNKILKPSEGYNLNGIVYAGNGVLLVGKHNTGEIFKVDMKKHYEIKKVILDSDIIGLDELTLQNQENLIGVLNVNKHEAVRITTKDNWKTAVVTKVVETKYEIPSSVTMSDEKAWVLNGRLGSASVKESEKITDFMLQRFE